MDNVTFQEPQYEASRASRQAPSASRLERLVLRSGIAKDAVSAQKALLVIALLILALTGYIFISAVQQPELDHERIFKA